MEYAMQMDSELLCGLNVPIKERERRRIVDHYMLTRKSNKNLRKPRGGMKSRDLYNELNRINPIRRNIITRYPAGISLSSHSRKFGGGTLIL